jgi:predicted dithiol-disulfide oxidoreductase (DUF899 family)
MSLPDVVSPEQWRKARIELLAREKEHTRQRDALNADRRRLPMVKIDEDYVFEGPQGKVTLSDLFNGKRQLIIQHVMYGPDWEAPCPGCSASINEQSQGVFDHLASRDTAFAMVSRAPYDMIARAAKERGWFAPWYSAYDSDFNYDFEVSFDPSQGPVTYNYAPTGQFTGTEAPGLSCFLRDRDAIYHTYSVFARGTEYLGNAYTLLDLTALGRQEAWEEPSGRVETPHPADPTFQS